MTAKELIAEADAYAYVLLLLGHSINVQGYKPRRPNQVITVDIDGEIVAFKLWDYPGYLKARIYRDITELRYG